MDLMQLIEAHTTFAPKAPGNVPAAVPLEVRRRVWAVQRQADLNVVLYGDVA